MSAPIYWRGHIYILNRRSGSNLQDEFFEHLGFTWHRLFKKLIRCANILAQFNCEEHFYRALPIHPYITYNLAVASGNGDWFFTQKLHVQFANKSIATMPDWSSITFSVLTHLIFRYHLPLRQKFFLRCDGQFWRKICQSEILHYGWNWHLIFQKYFQMLQCFTENLT
jgi:hypothetical protein